MENSKRNAGYAGAHHTSDLAFWFSIRDGPNSVRSLEELQLASTMTGHLGSIAATGRPLDDDAAAAVTWPAWEGVQQSVLVLQTPSSGGIRVVPRLREELCEFWATIPDRFVPIT
jgi:carboxylesterase type B